MLSLLKNSQIVRHSNAVTAGSSAITPSAGVDRSNAEVVTFLVPFGAITSGGVQSIEVHQSDDDGVADAYSALLGSNVVVADDDDNKVAVVEIVKPTKRYLKCVVNRATQNSAIDGILAILTGLKNYPVTQGATVVAASESHASPAEGTA